MQNHDFPRLLTRSYDRFLRRQRAVPVFHDERGYDSWERALRAEAYDLFCRLSTHPRCNVTAEEWVNHYLFR